MDLTLRSLEKTTYWRIYCRAAEHGTSVNDEILAVLNAGNREIPPDPEARLAMARKIRAEVSAKTSA